MEKKKILVTGGSGFLGSHLCQALVGKYDVSVIDHNAPTVPGVKLVTSLIRRECLDLALEGIDTVIHLASKNGIEYSMKCPTDTMDVNVMKTVLLFEAIKKSKVKKVIFTSSSTVYGEGQYKCDHCHEFITPVRDYIRYKSWECFCADCGNIAKPSYTPETFEGTPLSFYALSKMTQEKILRMLIPYGIKVEILRFPIVYGPGQTEKSKYAGAVGTIIKRALDGQDIEIIEDGRQLRDFLYVKDCIDSILTTIECGDSHILNIATGKKNTLLDLCNEIQKNLDVKLNVKILGTHRPGDSRHNLLSVTKATGYIGFNPKYTLEMGIAETVKSILKRDPQKP